MNLYIASVLNGIAMGIVSFVLVSLCTYGVHASEDVTAASVFGAFVCGVLFFGITRRCRRAIWPSAGLTAGIPVGITVGLFTKNLAVGCLAGAVAYFASDTRSRRPSNASMVG